MKKVLIIVAVVAAVGMVACNRHKKEQCCVKQDGQTEVKEKVEDAARAVGTAVKVKTENAVDTVREKARQAELAATRKAEAVKDAAARKAAAVKEAAERKAEAVKERVSQDKKNAGAAIVNAAEKVQDKLDD